MISVFIKLKSLQNVCIINLTTNFDQIQSVFLVVADLFCYQQSVNERCMILGCVDLKMIDLNVFNSKFLEVAEFTSRKKLSPIIFLVVGWVFISC